MAFGIGLVLVAGCGGSGDVGGDPEGFSGMVVTHNADAWIVEEGEGRRKFDTALISVDDSGRNVAYDKSHEIHVDGDDGNRKIFDRSSYDGTDENVWVLAWSPDSTSVAAALYKPEGPDLVIIDVASGEVVEYPQMTGVMRGAFSADGAAFVGAIHLPERGIFDVVELNLETGGVTPMLEGYSTTTITRATGGYFWVGEDLGARLSSGRGAPVYGFLRSGANDLRPSPANPGAPMALSPDETQIAYVVQNGANGNDGGTLVVQQLDDGTVTRQPIEYVDGVSQWDGPTSWCC